MTPYRVLALLIVVTVISLVMLLHSCWRDSQTSPTPSVTSQRLMAGFLLCLVLTVLQATLTLLHWLWSHP